ncbi:MAG: hypothetical protein ABIQ75_08630 [Flavobacteriales bacterium]
MKSTVTVVTLCTVLVVMGGCKKETTSLEPAPTAPAVNPLQQVFADNLVASTQHFTVNVDNTIAHIDGAHGFFGGFEVHAFRHADGSIVSGNVDIDLVEAYTVGQMLWLNKQTMGLQGGQLKPLVSGGQFRLRAFQNGVALRLAPDGGYAAVPSATFPDPAMEVFSGTLDGAGRITWTQWPNSPILPTDSALLDSIPAVEDFYYRFGTDSLNWINCDYFYSSSQPLTGIQVVCPSGYDHSNTAVWIVFPDLNSLANVYGGTGNVFEPGSGYEMPIGLNVVVVALSDIGGTYYSSFTNTTVTQGLNLPITLQPTTLAEFQAAAEAL